MKKQLLILVIALFASIQIYAQTEHDPPTCVGSAITPAVGVDYSYTVEVPNAGGYDGSGTYTWYVTQNVNLLDAAAPINPPVGFIASGAGAYNTANAGADVINITWQAAALANGNPYYLVVIYEQPAVCATNNVKVYRIVPQNTFWLAIDNITTVQCAAELTSATITEGATPTVEYIYGVNTITFSITAGGYLGDFAAELQLAGFNNEQTLLVEWAATRAATTGTFTAPATVNGIYTATLPAFTNAAAETETITVTITVTNNNYENLAGQYIDIAIDGTYASGATIFDDLSDVNGDCTPSLDFADAVEQTISARPTINPINPTPFVSDPTTVTP